MGPPRLCALNAFLLMPDCFYVSSRQNPLEIPRGDTLSIPLIAVFFKLPLFFKVPFYSNGCQSFHLLFLSVCVFAPALKSRSSPSNVQPNTKYFFPFVIASPDCRDPLSFIHRKNYLWVSFSPTARLFIFPSCSPLTVKVFTFLLSTNFSGVSAFIFVPTSLRLLVGSVSRYLGGPYDFPPFSSPTGSSSNFRQLWTRPVCP